jgi:hypothetical protein
LAGFGQSVDDLHRQRTTEAVWKRSFCVILPCQHARQGLGEPVPRYTQRRELMDFLQAVSEIAL